MTLSVGAPAWAEDPAAAEAMFREGRALFAEGKTDAACQKFKASQALEASPGTLLNLAACHHAQGKTATAWAEFVAAARLARAQNKDRQATEANRRAAELEATLSYLTVRVVDVVPGLEVRRGGSLLEPSVYGVRVPVDPGRQALEASAPGYETFRVEVVIADGRKDEQLEIPRLRPKATSAAPAANGASPSPGAVERPSSVVSTQASPSDTGAKPSHALPWVFGGIGGAFLVSGAVAGVLSLRSNHAASELCPEPNNCNDPSARSTADRRDTEALIANIGVGVGLAGIGVAAFLFLTSKSEKVPPAHALIPTLAHDRAGLTWVEHF
jgi:serine/threonine-protein kinase